jgi:hypothetical protein
MGKLAEKREFLIDNKIFTREDVISLIRLFIKGSYDILDKSKETKRKVLIQKGWNESDIKDSDVNMSHSRLEFTFHDKSKYSGTTEDVTEIINILSNKETVEINLYFFELVSDSSFIIRIIHSDSDEYPSYAIVEGQDSDWVIRTFKTIEVYFSKCRNQSRFIKKCSFIIIPVTILTLNFFLINMLVYIIRKMHLLPKFVINAMAGDWIFFLVVLSFITLLPALLIFDRARKLWPGIEIQTSGDFQEIEEEKHNKLWMMIAFIIIPTIISFLLRIL